MISRLLIRAGADVNIANTGGQTPISIAAEKNHLQIVKLLIGAGAAVNIEDNEGMTPLYWAGDDSHVYSDFSSNT